MSIKSELIEVFTAKWDTAGYQTGSFIDLVMKIYACACSQCDYYDDTIDTACSNSGFSIDTIIPDDTGLSDNTTQKIFQTIEAAMSFRAAMIGMDNFAWFDFSTEDADCTEAGYASTSPRPTTKNSINMPEASGSSRNKMVFGNGIMVQVYYDTRFILRSETGDLWESVSLPYREEPYWGGCCFTGERFFIAPYQFQGVAVVSDTTAKNWSNVALPDEGEWELAASDGNGIVVAMQVDGRYSISTNHGLAFGVISESLSSVMGYVNYLCFLNGRFIAISETEKKIAWSSDLSSWQLKALTFTPGPMIYDGAKYITLRKNYYSIATSVDLDTWEIIYLPNVYNYYQGIAYGDGVYCAIVGTLDQISYSSDLQTWDMIQNSINSVSRNQIEYIAGRFYVIDESMTDSYTFTSPIPDQETLRIRIKTPMLEEYSDLSTEEVAAFDTLVSAQDFTSETYGTGSRRVITAGNSFSKAMGYLKAKKIEMDTYASSYGGTCAFSIDGIFEPPDGLPSKYSEYNLPGQLQTDKAYLCAKAILTGTPLGIVTFCICIKWHLCR